jgi:hypothetical protein
MRSQSGAKRRVAKAALLMAIVTAGPIAASGVLAAPSSAATAPAAAGRAAAPMPRTAIPPYATPARGPAPAARAATSAAPADTGPLTVINFADLADGTVVTDQYPSATFSSTSGNVNYVSDQEEYNTPSFICTGPADGSMNCSADTIVNFTSPVSDLTFDGVGINDTGQVAEAEVFDSSGLIATVPIIGHAGGYTAELEDLSAYSDVTSIDLTDITDGGGIGWTNFSFSPCEQVTQADGDYEFGGCVTEEDDATQDVTDAESNLDGIGVSASSSDPVTYDDGGSIGDELTSPGDSTMSLDLDGTQVPVSDGPLDDNLTAPITIPLSDGSSSGRGRASTATTSVNLAGLALSGTLDLTPVLSGGTPTGSLTATATAALPAVLGGGTGKLTATSTVNDGLTKAVVALDKTSFLQLFKLTNLTLTWEAGSDGDQTWQVKATASAGGTKTAKLTGSLTYDDDTLTAATLSVNGLSLAGLADLSALNIAYGDGGWQGTATLGSGASASTASISLAFDDTGLASATIDASNVSLFGVLSLTKFVLSYGGDTWDITATAADGGGASGSMTATDGVISDASLTVTKLSFLGKFTVDTASVSYAAQAPNSHCADVEGDSIWCGDWRVDLPSASTIDGVSGTLATADGSFASGSIRVDGTVPLLDGIVLTKLGGKVTINPPPTKISGTVGLRFGPKIRGISLIDLTGTLTRQLPGDGTSGSYDFDGSLSALKVLHGTAKVTVPGDGSATTFDLTANASLTGVSAVGDLTGSFTSDSLTLAGNVEIKVLGHKVSGTMEADSKGMAACGKYQGHQAGFEYDWATESVAFLGTKGCSEAGF